MRRWKNIIIHHSLTKDSKTVSWGAIRRYHKETLRWPDVGYHFGIELARDDYEVFVGSTLDKTGAHTKGRNRDSIGICFVGNFDDREPPLEQLKCSIPLIRWLMETYGITLEHIYGHRQFANKSCPGRRFDMDRFKEIIEVFGG